jgi:hypothetical protein
MTGNGMVEDYIVWRNKTCESVLNRTISPMRMLFVMALACALMSLLAVFCFSAMTIVPSSGAESSRAHMMIAAGGFLVAWLCLAVWANARLRATSSSIPPQWLRRVLIVVEFVYVFGVFILVIG